MLKQSKTFILGAGITGLCAGFKTGYRIFESKKVPGGLCLSYYVNPEDKMRLALHSRNGNAYRFEIGGGHWIFGVDREVLGFLGKFGTLKKYKRRSGLYFSKENLYVPYPLQNNLRYLPDKIKKRALQEIINKPNIRSDTLKDWLQLNFGKTLCEVFFFPFHDFYTAGLFTKISQQDYSKTPTDLSVILKGAYAEVGQVGYNAEFVYPKEGLNALVQNIARKCKINYRKEVVKINVKTRTIYFKDKTSVRYAKLISTLPLDKMVEMTNTSIKEKPDPYTSVLVLNIGAKKGKNCPNWHWLYNPDSKSRFHRIGFYSNVDKNFLPRGQIKNTVSIYIERAYPAGRKPTAREIREYSRLVSQELKDWGFIDKIEVIDPSWIDVAYTWSWPDSQWKKQAISLLEKYDIYQIGRYGRWKFQGIADSIKEGLACKRI
ncbi:MAG: FAD-dependent oxidoreductase [Candidatus Omnitrophota bacterium]|jgi:protoporphyrinogen oxidase